MDEWLENIRDNSNNCPLILIGNKSDWIKERKILFFLEQVLKMEQMSKNVFWN